MPACAALLFFQPFPAVALAPALQAVAGDRASLLASQRIGLANVVNAVGAVQAQPAAQEVLLQFIRLHESHHSLPLNRIR